jgi:hypothetical protein
MPYSNANKYGNSFRNKAAMLKKENYRENFKAKH